MGDLFKDMLKSDESLFLNPQLLEPDYQPKLLQFREGQQHHIADCIKPLLQRRNGKNIVVSGTPGVGKTLCLKHVLNELKEEYGSDIFCLYVNCWKKDTSFKVITEICEQIKYKWIHNKTFDELMVTISKLLNEKSLVLVLDEADKLQDQNIIYSLLEDIHRKCLILITNEKNFMAKLDNRVRSRLFPDILEFKPYTYEETEVILSQRIEYAFPKNVLEKEVFDAVVKKTSELGDIRAGLFLLKQSGENAETKSSRKINIEHLNQALLTLSLMDNGIDENDSLVEIIKENSGKNTHEIFKIYEKKEGKSLRTFQRKLKDLEKDNKIKIKEENKGFDGKRTLIEFLD